MVTDINSKCRSKAAFFSFILYNLRIIEPLHKHKLNFASAHNSMMHLTLKSENTDQNLFSNDRFCVLEFIVIDNSLPCLTITHIHI